LIIAAVSMFANEEVVADAFAKQVSSLFDFGLFAAHNSSDRTTEILAHRGHNVEMEIASSGYPQAETMSRLMRKAFENGADYVFPLDFDEFLPFANKAALEIAMRDSMGSELIFVKWRNIFSPQFELPIDKRLYNYVHEHSQIGKVIVSRNSWIRDPELSLTQGNHNVVSTIALKKSQAHFRLLHIPIQSRWQFAQKIFRGSVVAMRQQKIDGDASGLHWVDMAENPFPSTSEMSTLALDYGLSQCAEHTDLSIEEFEFSPSSGSIYFEGHRSSLETFAKYWIEYFDQSQMGDDAGSIPKRELHLVRMEVVELQKLLLAKSLSFLGLLAIVKRVRAVTRKSKNN